MLRVLPRVRLLSTVRCWSAASKEDGKFFKNYNSDNPPELDLEAVRRQLMYRSRQRGWLELDIIIGEWAQKNLNTLDRDQLLEYQKVLEMENPDLFKWLAGQEPIPPEADTPFLQELKKFVESRKPSGRRL
eukprot:GILJ01005612.1.p1 GENE.GILJ01005612.1~~GILJ01005612.1.p1  ORF type:complete len:140 (-),score=19.92 GILJ01005612.1:249-641(-)